MSRRAEGLLVRLCASALVVVPLCILFAPGEKGVLWLILVAIPLLRAAAAFAAVRREFTADAAARFLGWLAIAGMVVVFYAAAWRLAPPLVHEVKPAAGDFVLTEFRMELTTPEGVDPERLDLLDGPPQGAPALRQWIVYGLARAEAEGCLPERARAIKERARSARAQPDVDAEDREGGVERRDGGGHNGLYRAIAALARELGGARSCRQALSACLAPLLAPELEGKLKLLSLREGNVLVSIETSPRSGTFPPGRVEGRLSRSALASPSPLVVARIRDPKGSLIPGLLPEDSDVLLTLGPAGPQRLEVACQGLTLLHALVRPDR